MMFERVIVFAEFEVGVSYLAVNVSQDLGLVLELVFVHVFNCLQCFLGFL